MLTNNRKKKGMEKNIPIEEEHEQGCYPFEFGCPKNCLLFFLQ